MEEGKPFVIADDRIAVGTLNPGEGKVFGIQGSEPKVKQMVRTEEAVVMASQDRMAVGALAC